MGPPNGPNGERARFWKRSVPEEVDSELDFHVAMRTRQLIADGWEPAAAHTAAIARFGDLRAVNYECRTIATQRERDMKRTEYLGELVSDVRFAVRQLARARVFTAVAVWTFNREAPGG